jgi:hypothetical protein
MLFSSQVLEKEELKEKIEAVRYARENMPFFEFV